MADRKTRQASHAGSWYSADGGELASQLDAWLRKVGSSPAGARAIIGPHAGYSYSGETAAFAYKSIDPTSIRRVFILGPSHHEYIEGCALTTMTTLETPVGSLTVDQAVVSALSATRLFSQMKKRTDEDEHSIEMHLPYIAHAMAGHEFTVVTILVGDISSDAEERYAACLLPYFLDPQNLFVFSSDFCHWGQRFRYTHWDKSAGPIHSSIDRLDHAGMDLIASQSSRAFRRYLRETGNTICGRNPICILLGLLGQCEGQFEVRWLKYAQSSECCTMADSSVSYAAAAVFPAPP